MELLLAAVAISRMTHAPHRVKSSKETVIAADADIFVSGHRARARINQRNSMGFLALKDGEFTEEVLVAAHCVSLVPES